MNRYQQELEKRKESGLLRALTTSSNQIDFFSNDYLGFSRSQELSTSIEKEYEAKESKRMGSTGSRLLSGNSAYAELIEKSIADFHNTESALLFSSGYNANVGLLSALGKKGVTYISDELIHASMIDGIRLSLADKVKFKHNDLQDLENKLSKVEGEKIVLIESIYSMDGDVAPLESILEICHRFQAELIVDEAHAIGVAGSKGEGMCSSLGIQKDVLATVVTFGKAMGIHGAAVLGENWLRNYLINFARSFIYSTAPSDHQLASIKCSYTLNDVSSSARDQLKSNIDYFISKRTSLTSLHWIDSATQIQSLIIPGNDEVIQAAKTLQENGMDILPIRSPSVLAGTERLRISLHAFNTKEEIDQLFSIIEKWNQKN